MRKLSLFVACLVLGWTPAEAANLATFTPAPVYTPAASPSPDTGQSRNDQVPNVGGFVWERANIAEGGQQIGSTASGASLLTFVKRGICTFDLPAIAAVATPIVGPPNFVTVSCTATGAAVGDSVFASFQNWSTTQYLGLALNSAVVSAANTLQFTFTHGSLAGLDAAPLTVNYLVVR